MLKNIENLLTELKKTPIKDVCFVHKKEEGFKNVENQIYIYIPSNSEYKVDEIPNSCDEVLINQKFVLVASFNCVDKSELLKVLFHSIMRLDFSKINTFKIDNEEIYLEETNQVLGHRANFIKINFSVTECVDVSCIGQICEPCC